MGNSAELIHALRHISERRRPPSAQETAAELAAVCRVLDAEHPHLRPPDSGGLPGGVVNLRPELPLVALPDIHGRQEFILAALSASYPDHGIQEPLLYALDAGRAQLLFVGDYVHAEARARERWMRAFKEFSGGFKKHAAMDQEMNENLGVLQTFALLKQAYPDIVHGLKGNHENISNEEGEGNHAFGKFVLEGAMVVEYMERFYPGAPFEAVYRLEKSLPLLAVGSSFLMSHAEPARFFGREEVIEYRSSPEVVEGLTWTDNDQAEPGSVYAMLEHFLRYSEPHEAMYLGGHRPVESLYALRAEGRYVQFHNPARYVVALPPVNRLFDPERDVLELQMNRTLFDG
ncbi:MAG: calcineurin [Spirochaetaceae bacterium]|nr:MAG: calcineurin [Spirochaetaceae bacterium]